MITSVFGREDHEKEYVKEYVKEGTVILGMKLAKDLPSDLNSNY